MNEVTMGVRKKDEIRPCYKCGCDCRKTYFRDEKGWLCVKCEKKLRGEQCKQS